MRRVIVEAPVTLDSAQSLPELAAVYWRRRVDEPTLRRSAHLWTLTTIAHRPPL